MSCPRCKWKTEGDEYCSRHCAEEDRKRTHLPQGAINYNHRFHDPGVWENVGHDRYGPVPGWKKITRFHTKQG